MFVRSEAKNKGLQTVTLNIGEFFDLEHEEVEVTLREVSIEQSLLLSQSAANNEEIANTFLAMLPEILVSHNLYENPEELMTTEAVVELFKAKGQLVSAIMREFTNALFRTPPKVSNEK